MAGSAKLYGVGRTTPALAPPGGGRRRGPCDEWTLFSLNLTGDKLLFSDNCRCPNEVKDRSSCYKGAGSLPPARRLGTLRYGPKKNTTNAPYDNSGLRGPGRRALGQGAGGVTRPIYDAGRFLKDLFTISVIRSGGRPHSNVAYFIHHLAPPRYTELRLTPIESH
ncbi:hypothetical protein EVAR_98764_1 [Eumeta japonica]|uniref:Uncharacterized protein n=1 Tax=Eumeta variegata TaxID=151549 RepID=A0A4C1YXU7_EUMVA|nr:hypothetical protein EVAR_98764_1 [Eumeta japonica]